jgi:hypothetical protein
VQRRVKVAKMKIPSYPADEVIKGGEAILSGDDDGLFKVIRELRGLVNDVKPLAKMFQDFKGGVKMGQDEAQKRGQFKIDNRADPRGGMPHGAAPAGITEQRAAEIAASVVKSMIIDLLDFGIKAGYGDKTLSEVLPMVDFKLKDIREFLNK